jgi:hypothetical protein
LFRCKFGLPAAIAILASAEASGVTKVVAVGDPAPGAGTFDAYAGLSPSLLGANDRGDVLFWSGISGGFDAFGVFLFLADGPIVKIVTEGQIAPVEGHFVNILPSTTNYRLNSGRDIAFLAQVDSGDGDGGVFLWSYSTRNIRKVVVSGDRAPLPTLIEPTSEPDIFTPSFGAVDLNENGDVLFGAMQGKRVGESYVSIGAVYLWSDRYGIDRWVTSGVLSEAGRLDISPGTVLGPIGNINQEFLIWAMTSRPTQGIFRCKDGSCHTVVAVGDPIPGGEWPNTSGPCCIVGFNDSGQVGLQGLSPGGEILVWSAGSFQSDIAYGYPITAPITATLNNIFVRSGDLHPINNGGQIGFSGATVEGGPAAPGVFLLLSDGTLTKPVSAGDPAAEQGSFTAFGRVTLNNPGRLAFEATTTAPFGYYSSIWQTDPP